MYHFVQYLYHFIFILLWHWLYHDKITYLWVLPISEVAKIGAIKPIFLDFGCPRWKRVRACVGKVCYEYIVHILKSNKNYFFAPTSNLCRAMLPNYLRTYSCALCQIRALEKAFKKPNNGQSAPKILPMVLNACIWLAKTNSQNLHAIS